METVISWSAKMRDGGGREMGINKGEAKNRIKRVYTEQRGRIKAQFSHLEHQGAHYCKPTGLPSLFLSPLSFSAFSLSLPSLSLSLSLLSFSPLFLSLSLPS